jgi:HD-GYP domain-containing protein (c-di-GMP phosphodiesterase class II)
MNSIQAGKLYSEEHPQFKEFVENLYAILQDILQVKKELILGIVSRELAWEDEIFFDLSQKLGALIDFLEDNRIERIIFQQGLRFEELSQFISYLAQMRRQEKVDEQEYFSLRGIQNIRAGRIRSLEKIQGAEEKSQEMMKKYDSSLQTISNSLNLMLDEKEIDYLDLRFNILNFMEDFMGRHQELISLVSVKQRDLITFAHLMNVSLLSMFFASKLEFSKDDVLDLGIAALYHDVGKLFISLKIIHKKAGLAEKEFIQMRDHPLLGARILDSYKDTLGILPLVVAFEHHLRYDLTGYPRVAYPRRPHIASLMISICDVYDALALKRSYKTDYPPDKIYELMMLEKGKMFDPQLLDKFFQIMGVWPVGTVVLLSDDRVAIVREINEQDIFSPKVEVIAPESKGEIINLDKNRKVQITEALNPHGKGEKYLSFISKS